MTPQVRRAIGLWLLACCGMVALTLVVGGATRLTRSGLSITEWKPLSGIVPPMSDEAWTTAFEAYRQTPEYRLVNRGMSLDEFKGIYWWEFWHRVVGRLIGVVVLVPYLWFLARGALPRRLAWRLAGIFVLGGLQGALGWFMVQSGLQDVPMVSPIRLTAHLSLALVIFVLLLWTVFEVLRPEAPATVSAGAPAPPLRRGARLALVVAAYMVVTGGLVAGLRAGKVFRTFPLMDGDFIPPGLYALEPWWRNLFENMTAVQWHHRMGAWIFTAVVLAILAAARRPGTPPLLRTAAGLLGATLVLQITLGAFTVIHGVPVILGVAHQAGAVLVLSAATWFTYLQRGH